MDGTKFQGKDLNVKVNGQKVKITPQYPGLTGKYEAVPIYIF